jgi:hypothetical protein
MGFPRSGTTLLEQLLASHPDVVTLDERETLPTRSHFLNSSGRSRALLRRLDDELAGLPRAVLMRVREGGCPGQWASIHRQASAEHPQVADHRAALPGHPDPVRAPRPARRRLSCYRRRFRMSPPMYELLTCMRGRPVRRRDAARGVRRGCLRLPLHVVRHEALVTDFETEVKGGVRIRRARLDGEPARIRSAREAQHGARRPARHSSPAGSRPRASGSGVGTAITCAQSCRYSIRGCGSSAIPLSEHTGGAPAAASV